MSLKPLFLSVSALFLVACQTSPDVQTLQESNAQLRLELTDAKQQINSLQAEHKIMAGDNAELKRLIGILQKETKVRTQEIDRLRGLSRSFGHNVLAQVKDFLADSELLDYVGSSLVERSKIGIDAVVVADFAHPMPSAIEIFAVDGVFAQSTRFKMNVLRPMNDQELVVIWQSPVIEVTRSGRQRLILPNVTEAQAGDIVAFQFPDGVGVKYDVGTGNALYTKKPFNLGDTVKQKSFEGESEKRTYSLGVAGYFKK